MRRCWILGLGLGALLAVAITWTIIENNRPIVLRNAAGEIIDTLELPLEHHVNPPNKDHYLPTLDGFLNGLVKEYERVGLAAIKWAPLPGPGRRHDHGDHPCVCGCAAGRKAVSRSGDNILSGSSKSVCRKSARDQHLGPSLPCPRPYRRQVTRAPALAGDHPQSKQKHKRPHTIHVGPRGPQDFIHLPLLPDRVRA